MGRSFVRRSGGAARVCSEALEARVLLSASLVHRWAFDDGTARDSVGHADGTLYNGAAVVDGSLRLDGVNDYLRTAPIEDTITKKTLVAWLSLDNLTQTGGGALSLETPAADRNDVFDAVVYGEALERRWMAGSDYFNRTQSAQAQSAAAPEDSTGAVMMAVVYGDGADDRVKVYRNGALYADYVPPPGAAGRSDHHLQSYEAGRADLLMGVRHESYTTETGTRAGADAYFAGSVYEARVYSGAMTADEIRETFAAGPGTSVVGRHVFYNHSAYDGNNALPTVEDDAAVAPDKRALRPGEKATFDNVSSSANGINGVMVDLVGLAASPTAADFYFRQGKGGNSAEWDLAPAPSVMSVRPGAGVGGSDRVELLWADRSLRNTWLQVTVRATPATGLAAPDVFYFGNLVGETGNSAAAATVNAIDLARVRAAQLSQSDLAGRYDFDRNRTVNAIDLGLARANQLQSIELFTAPPAGIDNRSGYLRINGGGDFVRVPHSASLDLASAITMEAWVRFEGTEQNAGLELVKRGDGNQGYGLGTRGPSQFSGGIFSRHTNQATVPGTFVREWHHVAWTFDGSVSRTFFDGELVQSLDYAGSIGRTNNDLYFGIGINGDGTWNGSTAEADYDEVRIWNRARTPAEIAGAFDRPLAGNEAGLVGYWNFNQLDARDSSPSGNHGVASPGVEFVAPSNPAPAVQSWVAVQWPAVLNARRLEAEADLLHRGE